MQATGLKYSLWASPQTSLFHYSVQNGLKN